MDNKLPIDITLKHYNELLKVKQPSLQSKYPFSITSEEDVEKTLKQIELVYQNLTPDVPAFVRLDNNSKRGKTNKWKGKRGGGYNQITIFTM